MEAPKKTSMAESTAQCIKPTVNGEIGAPGKAAGISCTKYV